jgi:FkbM family methyltransferase
MRTFASLGRYVGNQLYRYAFPIYRPLYSTFKSYADRTERGLLRHHLLPGSIVVDAGANIGIYSAFLSQCVSPTGQVHSFEPDQQNFTRMQAALGHIPVVRLNQLALSDKTGEATLYVSRRLNVDHRIYPVDGEARESVPIRTVRLDDYFKTGDRIDLIKMDIQGNELHALRGAERLLRENPRIKLLLELWPYGLRQAGTTWSDLITHLQDRGFTLQEISPAGLSPLPPDSVREGADWYLNVFASR